MAIEVVKGEGTWTVKLAGTADIFDATAMHRAACEAVTGAQGPVVVSLHEVEAMDTSIAQVLLALKRALADAGRELRVEGASPAVLASWQRLGVEVGG